MGVLAAAVVASWAFAGSTKAAGTTVPLGTADPYAILAGSGITNTGATTISGDTGSSPTNSETGFGACPAANCVSQTGANHIAPDPNDSATQSAKAALTNAYNVAAGQPPTTIPTELAGQTLAPGVYTSASGTFGMTGTLTLDAANDPNAVFIFQTADGTGTLITAAYRQRQHDPLGPVVQRVLEGRNLGHARRRLDIQRDDPRPHLDQSRRRRDGRRQAAGRRAGLWSRCSHADPRHDHQVDLCRSGHDDGGDDHDHDRHDRHDVEHGHHTDVDDNHRRQVAQVAAAKAAAAKAVAAKVRQEGSSEEGC